MSGKGKFLYIKGAEKDRIFIKDSAFQFNSDEDLAFPLSKFSTDDLLKVKAQIATELENRMDLDEVTEANLNRLIALVKSANGETIAQVIRQTLDRLDVVAADERRAKVRLEILTDELKRRMVADGQSDVKFAGLISATYKPEAVFSVGEEGWEAVYSGIMAQALSAQDGAAKQKLISTLVDQDYNVEQAEEIADTAIEAVINSVKNNFAGVDAFSILQKRLTSTTLNDLVKQGKELPSGIEQTEIRKVRVKRSK